MTSTVSHVDCVQNNTLFASTQYRFILVLYCSEMLSARLYLISKIYDRLATNFFIKERFIHIKNKSQVVLSTYLANIS